MDDVAGAVLALGDLLPTVLDARGSLTLRSLLDRTADPDGYQRWWQQVQHTGGCACPVRLRGRVDEVDTSTGELRAVYSTDGEPDQTLLKACGTRRESRCPSCARTYQRDAFHLVASGLRGGKGVPASVLGHPRVFATFTAPGFGPVHGRRVDGSGRTLPCTRRDPKVRCAHGRPVACWTRHEEGDARIGAPICPGCLDAAGLVVWNALAPELWRRTTIAIRREVARLAGVTERECRGLVRLTFVKTAEYQARGAVHFHVVLRLDGAGGEAGEVAPPSPFTAGLLVAAVLAAAGRVEVPVPVAVGHVGPVPVARWGEQVDASPMPDATDSTDASGASGFSAFSDGSDSASDSPLPSSPSSPSSGLPVAGSPGGRPEGVGGWGRWSATPGGPDGVPAPTMVDAIVGGPAPRPPGPAAGATPATPATVATVAELAEAAAGRAAGYVAKYTVKGAETLGLPDRRLITGADAAALAERARRGDLPAHVARLVQVAWELGGLGHLAALRLRAWAHMAGFRGHFVTKSRAYSTTFGRLRRARAEHARSRHLGRAGGRVALGAPGPGDAWALAVAAGRVVRVTDWRVVGVGYRTPADAWLAMGAAARAREHA